MAGNQVTLTFAGDSAQLESAFDRVGKASKQMETDVGSAGASFDGVRDGFDTAEQRAMGFRDTITGVQDSMKGLGAIAKGDLSADAFLTLGMGIGDLASGFANLLVPMAKTAATFVAQKTAMVAHAVASGTVKAATLAWTGVQWLLNAALTANPIGLIIVGIGLLVGAIIWIATKTTWFQTAWKFAWGGIKSAAVAVWNWLKDLPGKIGRVFVTVAEFIGRPFRKAFNMVAELWNNTIGRLSWTVPDWIPGIGGKTIAVPQLPVFKFHAGGRVPGAPGTEVMARLQAGETVLAAGQRSGSLGPDDLRSGSAVGFDRVMLTYLEGLMRRNNLRLVRA